MGLIFTLVGPVLTCFTAWALSSHYLVGPGSSPVSVNVNTVAVVLLCIPPWLAQGIIARYPVSTTAMSAALYLLLVCYMVGLILPKTRMRESKFSNPISCRNILATTGCDDSEVLTLRFMYHQPLRNVLPGVGSRSEPNKRLRESFGVDNSFTTMDEAYCQRFRNSAERKLNLSAEKWKQIALTAQTITHDQITNTFRVGFVHLVQVLSLRITLHVLFGLDPAEGDENDIGTIAAEINRLWLESKGERALDAPFFADEGKLVRALCAVISEAPQGARLTYVIPAYRTFQRVVRRCLPQALHWALPNIDFTSRTNPLNYILPAYETLWRVVLRCFVEVAFRNEANSPDWRHVLGQFLEAPSLSTLKDTTMTSSGISAECIVNEALRLYPPTRRVYRKFQLVGADHPEVVVADLEACHRTPSIWGEESRRFDPSRWTTIDNGKDSVQHAAFMPFGVKRFLCPANTDFGPRMIALLVAALASTISADEWDLVRTNPRDEHMDPGEPLNSGRHAFWSYDLIRKTGLARDILAATSRPA